MNIILSVFFVICSAVLTRLFCILAQNTRLMDKPNERSMHSIPVVRGGGIVFIALPLISLPLLCYFMQTSMKGYYVLMVSILLLATVSFLDDVYHLSIKHRLLVQSLVALLIALFMRPEQLDFVQFSITTGYLIAPILFFAVLWAINHFNFMDGLDGFCASQALFLFVSYGLLFSLNGGVLDKGLCFIFVFSLTGFLIFNFPPAKLFMGDVGSASLGLITFLVAIIAQQKYQTPIVYWIMLNGLFLFDASITLIRRFLKKEKWSAPHKKHAYQRLKQFGVDGRFILLGQLVMNGIFLILVLLAQFKQVNLSLLILLQIAFLFLIYYLIEQFSPMFRIINND